MTYGYPELNQPNRAAFAFKFILGFMAKLREFRSKLIQTKRAKIYDIILFGIDLMLEVSVVYYAVYRKTEQSLMFKI